MNGKTIPPCRAGRGHSIAKQEGESPTATRFEPRESTGNSLHPDLKEAPSNSTNPVYTRTATIYKRVSEFHTVSSERAIGTAIRTLVSALRVRLRHALSRMQVCTKRNERETAGSTKPTLPALQQKKKWKQATRHNCRLTERVLNSSCACSDAPHSIGQQTLDYQRRISSLSFPISIHSSLIARFRRNEGYSCFQPC